MGTPLVKRLNIVVTRNPDYYAEGVVVMSGLKSALEFAEKQGQKMVFILGGGEIYKQAISVADKMYITEIQATFEGDTYFPPIEAEHWQEIERQDFDADELNKYAYSFVEYQKK